MKVKHAIIFVVVGICFDFMGVLFKIIHYANGDTLLIFATFLKIFGLLLLLNKILAYPKFKDFLNW